MKTWAIGDIHGYAPILDALLRYIPLAKDDRLLFLGDMIDRGPETPQVLETIRRLSHEREVILLRGNHEQMMLQARYDYNFRRQWLLAGGDATVDAFSMKTMDDIPNVVWKLLESTLPYFETESAIYVHANIDPQVEMNVQCEDDLYWKFCTDPSPHVSGKFMVCGHTYQESGLPRLWRSAICADTLNSQNGEGWLTAVDISKRAFWQVDSNGRKRFDSFESIR